MQICIYICIYEVYVYMTYYFEKKTFFVLLFSEIIPDMIFCSKEPYPTVFYSGQQLMRPLHNVSTRSLYRIMFNIIIMYTLTCTYTYAHNI